MERRAIGALFLAGMAVPLAGFGQAGPAWGKPNREGIATRVVPLEKAYILGEPMILRIEAKNTGDELVYADLQSLAHCWALLNVVDGEGTEVLPIGATIMGCQTIQAYTPFPPGEVVPLVPQLDLGGEFAMFEAGTYHLKYPGDLYAPPKFDVREATIGVDGKRLDGTTKFTQLPSSGLVEIEVQPGELSAELKMIRALQPVTPKGWFLCRRWKDRGVTIGLHGEAADVTIDLVPVDPEAGIPMEEGQRKLGTGSLGEIRMAVTIGAGKGVGEPPEDRTLESFWEGAQKTIRQALRLEPAGQEDAGQRN